MIIVQPGENFGFNYTAYDQSPSLFVAFSIYDASGGTPIFLEKVNGTYAGFGAYAANYLAQPGIKYLVIGLVYTSGSYATVDTTRAPFSEVYQADAETIVDLGFTYVTYNFAAGLSIQAKIYNTTTSSPVLQDTVDLEYVGFGIYYGHFTGTISENFQIIGVVYTDNTFTVVDFNYAPSSISFACIGSTPVSPLNLSTQVDVSDLMYDTDFVDGMALITRTPTVNTLGENVVTEMTLNSFGSVQPASGRTLARLPEALRLENVQSFWFRGVIVATAPNQYPCILVFKGFRYQVRNVMDWSTWGRGWTEGLCVAELPS